MTRSRLELGHAGERLGAAFLYGHGLEILARNVEVAGGEIDILARDGTTRVAVEVRTVRGPGGWSQAFGYDKSQRVHRLASRIGADRVDLVAIRMTEKAAEVRWVVGVS